MRNNQIEIIARAIIVDNGQILLCQTVDSDYYFLPGGHVEFGETAEQALRRELKEELGASIDKLVFLQPIENIFKAKGQPRHEINLLYLATLKSRKSKSKEKHLKFIWQDIKQLSKVNLKPANIKNLIIK